MFQTGEANSKDDLPQKYVCSLASMVDDWRITWYNRTDSVTDELLPFGQVQVHY